MHNGWMLMDVNGNYFGWDSMKRVRFERLTWGTTARARLFTWRWVLASFCTWLVVGRLLVDFKLVRFSIELLVDFRWEFFKQVFALFGERPERRGRFFIQFVDAAWRFQIGGKIFIFHRIDYFLTQKFPHFLEVIINHVITNETWHQVLDPWHEGDSGGIQKYLRQLLDLIGNEGIIMLYNVTSQ